MKGVWVPHDTRDAIVDYMKYWSDRAEIPCDRLLAWTGLHKSKYHHWRKRYGKVNAHNGQIPRDWWLEEWKKQAIIDYHDKHSLEGDRRVTFMMLDDDVVSVSPSSTYRVLKAAGRLDRRHISPSKKGTGFVQPTKIHQEWHTDISYLNLGGTFYFLISVLDGFSRYIVHWEIRETMKEFDIELVITKPSMAIGRVDHLWVCVCHNFIESLPNVSLICPDESNAQSCYMRHDRSLPTIISIRLAFWSGGQYLMSPPRNRLHICGRAIFDSRGRLDRRILAANELGRMSKCQRWKCDLAHDGSCFGSGHGQLLSHSPKPEHIASDTSFRVQKGEAESASLSFRSNGFTDTNHSSISTMLLPISLF